MQLQALVDHLALGVRGPPFCHGRGFGIQFVFQHQADQSVDKSAGHGNLGFHFRQGKAGVLKIQDRLAKGLTLFSVLNGPFHGRFHVGHGRDG